MRFVVIWLDGEGFANYAEYFDHPDFPSAQRFLANKVARKATIRPAVSGFLLTYADSAFIRRYTIKQDTVRSRQVELCEIELACAEFPHLLRP